MTSNPRRALDRWARDHADVVSFNAYLAIGGTISVARDDINKRIERLTDALLALREYAEPVVERERDSPSRRENHIIGATVGPEALARLEADQSGGEPPDPDNAHVQGANDAV